MTAAPEPLSTPSRRRRQVAEAVAAAVDGVPGVRRTAGGSGVEVSTLHPGGRVIGVGLREESVLICVALSRLPVPTVAQEIAAAAEIALKAVGDKRKVEVEVDDLDLDHFPC